MRKIKNMLEEYCIYVKSEGQKKAHFHLTEDGVGWWNDRHEVEDVVNHIYTDEQEITIRQCWYTNDGYTGKDIVARYPMVKREA